MYIPNHALGMSFCPPPPRPPAIHSSSAQEEGKVTCDAQPFQPVLLCGKSLLPGFGFPNWVSSALLDPPLPPCLFNIAYILGIWPDLNCVVLFYKYLFQNTLHFLYLVITLILFLFFLAPF